jgi:hypothetical protein
MDYHHLVIDGRLAGGWQRHTRGQGVRIAIDPFRTLSTDEARAVEVEAQRLGAFLARPLDLAWQVR